MIGCFATLLLVEEVARKDEVSGPNLLRISTNWGLALVNWTLAVLIPASSLAAATWSGPGLLSGWPAALAFLPLLLLRSFAAYWLHRWLHVSRWLWRIHRVHHADSAIDCSTGLRNHPFEVLATIVLTTTIVLALGPPLPSVAAVDAVLLITSFWQHAAIRLPEGLTRRLEWALTTPRWHLSHHSQARQEHDSNFGDIVSLWDRMFGTFAPPRSDAIKLGLPEEASGAQSLPRQLASPFRP